MEYDFSIIKNILIIFDDPSSDGFKATFSKATVKTLHNTVYKNSRLNKWP